MDHIARSNKSQPAQSHQDGGRLSHGSNLPHFQSHVMPTAAPAPAKLDTEAHTRVSDRPDAVTDDIWSEAAWSYDEPALAALIIAIANIAVRQPAGEWIP